MKWQKPISATIARVACLAKILNDSLADRDLQKDERIWRRWGGKRKEERQDTAVKVK